MIISWKHKRLRDFFEKGKRKGIDAIYITTLNELLLLLDTARSPADIGNIAGFHPLKGDKKGLYAVKVSANWRLTFTFEGNNIAQVNYEDYH